MNRNMTARMRVESQGGAMLEALRESEERYRELVERSPQGIIVRQGDKYILANQSFADLVGYSIDELLEFTTDEIYALVSPDDQEMIAQRYRDRQAGKLVPDDYEHRFIHKDGETRWARVTVAKVEIQGEQAFLGMYLDVTERKRAEEALRERNAELDAYAHTVAHDLKGPLTHIVGFAQILEQSYAELPAEQVRDHLRTISQSGSKMGNIIDELLLLAILRKAKIELNPLDMASVVDKALGRLAYMIEEYQAQIVLPESWPVALGHGPWVEEVWVNYLSNALKYGASPPRVELGGEDQADGTVRYWVRDNGPGLTPEEQERLFRPFERLHRVRAKGHGLGLSIVRRIVEKLGGQVGVESKVGQGSVFSFSLPGAKR
ncbi:MAG: PAS domain S-box protein [Chloroflexi bacterium]|nr:PAS domain S-box protein [Chloroflexota bacterium]